jgi:hypothetical protein
VARDFTAVSDDEMVFFLGTLCSAFEDADPVYKEMEHDAVELGKLLNERGGIEEMRRVFSLLGGWPGRHSLVVLWDGIGDWRCLAGSP